MTTLRARQVLKSGYIYVLDCAARNVRKSSLVANSRYFCYFWMYLMTNHTAPHGLHPHI